MRARRWDDWVVWRRRADGQVEEINVGRRIRLKRGAWAAMWLVGAAVAYNFWGGTAGRGR